MRERHSAAASGARVVACRPPGRAPSGSNVHSTFAATVQSSRRHIVVTEDQSRTRANDSFTETTTPATVCVAVQHSRERPRVSCLRSRRRRSNHPGTSQAPVPPTFVVSSTTKTSARWRADHPKGDRTEGGNLSTSVCGRSQLGGQVNLSGHRTAGEPFRAPRP